MDNLLKSTIAVISALVMLAVAAYLTFHSLNPPHSTLQQAYLPTGTPTSVPDDGLFHFVNPHYVPAAGK